MGFYFATNTDNRINYGPALENVVFNYAKSKGYKHWKNRKVRSWGM